MNAISKALDDIERMLRVIGTVILYILRGFAWVLMLLLLIGGTAAFWYLWVNGPP